MEQSNIPVLPLNRALLIYVIGCPGSGKGTLCKLLARDYVCRHISVGDLLRTLKDDQDYQNVKVKDCIETGKLLPTTTIVNILTCVIRKELGSYQAIIVDGFPRRLDQGIAAEDQASAP
ncbi:hypothetical protein B7463_g5284, partial [Scytalidium lignicola]